MVCIVSGVFKHFLSFLSNCYDFSSFHVRCHYGGFRKNNPFALHVDNRVGGAKVYAYVVGKKD